jgi:hypothetical protein
MGKVREFVLVKVHGKQVVSSKEAISSQDGRWRFYDRAYKSL